MKTTVSLDIDYGNRLQDSRTGSVLNLPSLSCISINECGDITHQKAGYSATINRIDDAECVVKDALTFSHNSLCALASDIDIDIDPYRYSGNSSGIQITTSIDAMVKYAWQVSQGIDKPINILLGSRALERVDLIDYGNRIVLRRQNSTRGAAAEITKPFFRDITLCDVHNAREFGMTLMIAGSVTLPGNITPTYTTIWQASIKIIASEFLYPRSNLITENRLSSDLLLLGSDIVAGYPQCPVDHLNVSNQWKGPLYNSSQEIGV